MQRNRPYKPKMVVIVGPTASGKSEIGVKLARRFGGEVISADSRQIYRGLDIATGKIREADKRGVPHHLLDIANPKKPFTAAEYRKRARAAIADIIGRGKLPIVVGGTGFYVAALLGEAVLPQVPPNPEFRLQLDKLSTSALYRHLSRLDARRAREIDRNNRQRLIRAIEIASVLGKVPRAKQSSSHYDALKLGIAPSPEKLSKRIKDRVRSRLRGGMVAEAAALHPKGLSWKRMEEIGLTYKYLALFLQGKINQAEMKEKITTEEWRYAKRQKTWFKRDKEIKWFKPDEYQKIQERVRRFLLQ